MAKLALRASLLLFLCFTMASTMMVQAKTAVVGVSQGDIFEYDMVAYWDSLFTDAPSAELLALNQTEWIRVTVTEVSDSLISMQVTTHYRNGTEISLDGFCDIETGELSEGPPFIGANLGKNDLVNPSASEPWYINETVTRTYADGTRETNHLIIVSKSTSETVGELTHIYDYYFDKSTGALVEYAYEFSYSGYASIQHSKLISSNVWLVHGDGGLQPEDSPDSSTAMYVAAAAVAITILIVAAAIILKKRNKKRKKKAKK